MSTPTLYYNCKRFLFSCFDGTCWRPVQVYVDRHRWHWLHVWLSDFQWVKTEGMSWEWQYWLSTTRFLPFDDREMPYFILGDDAFDLGTFIMKPYSQRGMTKEHWIFNYRISRGRSLVENAFGILPQRFQVFPTTILLLPDNVRDVVEACICLHNLMRERYPSHQNAVLDRGWKFHNVIPGACREDVNMQEVDSASGPNRGTVPGKKMREYLRHYFSDLAGKNDQDVAVYTSTK
jgi:hypothetical protein